MATKVEYPKEATEPTVAISLTELEAMIRRVVREVIQEEIGWAFDNMFRPDEDPHPQPGSPLYEELAELAERTKRGEVELLSHAEVWDDETV